MGFLRSNEKNRKYSADSCGVKQEVLRLLGYYGTYFLTSKNALFGWAESYIPLTVVLKRNVFPSSYEMGAIPIILGIKGSHLSLARSYMNLNKVPTIIRRLQKLKGND